MQDTAQRYISNSISKTINLPNEATVEDIEKIFKLAMRLSTKGVTVFRDGSITHQILEANNSNDEEDDLDLVTMVERDHELSGKTRVHVDGDRKTYVTLNFNDDGDPVEAFITGETNVSVLLGRMISTGLRHGVPYKEILEQLDKTGGYSAEVGDVIRGMIEGESRSHDDNWTMTTKGFEVNDGGDMRCAACGSVNTIHMMEGCVACECGWSGCSV
jgi:ribonucleoside-diphosphate reductase alpha chain